MPLDGGQTGDSAISDGQSHAQSVTAAPRVSLGIKLSYRTRHGRLRRGSCGAGLDADVVFQSGGRSAPGMGRRGDHDCAHFRWNLRSTCRRVVRPSELTLGTAGTPSCTPRQSRSHSHFIASGNPPHGWSRQITFGYLIALLIAVRLLVSLYEIPSAALAPELTRDYDERTSLLSYRFFPGPLGGTAMAVLAFQVFLPEARDAPPRGCWIGMVTTALAWSPRW